LPALGADIYFNKSSARSILGITGCYLPIRVKHTQLSHTRCSCVNAVQCYSCYCRFCCYCH